MTDAAQEAARADGLQDALRAERGRLTRMRQSRDQLQRRLAVAQERNQQWERELQDSEARYLAAQQREQVWRRRYWHLREEYDRLLTRIATLAKAANDNQDRVLRAEGLDPARLQAPPVVGDQDERRRS